MHEFEKSWDKEDVEFAPKRKYQLKVHRILKYEREKIFIKETYGTPFF